MFGLWDGFFGSSDYDTDVQRTSELKHLQRPVDTSAHGNVVAAQTKDATRDRHQERAGVAGADFWQGTKENMKGIPNISNKANLGAILGTGHSTFDGQAKAGAAGERVSRTGNLAQGYVAASGAKGDSEMHDASLAQRQASHRADQDFQYDMVDDFDRSANWNMLGNFASGAASGVGARMSMDNTESFSGTRLGQAVKTGYERTADWFTRDIPQAKAPQPQNAMLGSGSNRTGFATPRYLEHKPSNAMLGSGSLRTGYVTPRYLEPR